MDMTVVLLDSALPPHSRKETDEMVTALYRPGPFRTLAARRHDALFAKGHEIDCNGQVQRMEDRTGTHNNQPTE